MLSRYVAAMSQLSALADPAEPLPLGWIEVASFPSLGEAEEHALVALAIAGAYWLQPTGDGYRLLVEGDLAERVRKHLAAYARERRTWPPSPVAYHVGKRSFDLVTPLLWSALALACFYFRWPEPDAALLDADAIFSRGEYWRAATALFVHANATHVISNALVGIWVFAAVIATLGRAFGWSLLALSAIAGNLAVAAINHGTPYRSLGASTAIFAGLGLLTGRAVATLLAHRRSASWGAAFVPLASGFTLLALFGAGDAPVDIGAHACGFLAGTVLGAAAYPFLRERSAGPQG